MDEEQLALVEEGLNLLLQKYKKNHHHAVLFGLEALAKY